MFALSKKKNIKSPKRWKCRFCIKFISAHCGYSAQPNDIGYSTQKLDFSVNSILHLINKVYILAIACQTAGPNWLKTFWETHDYP